jgi:hypothetical protein
MVHAAVYPCSLLSDRFIVVALFIFGLAEVIPIFATWSISGT